MPDIGDKVTASYMTSLRDDVNKTSTRYSMSKIDTPYSVGLDIRSAHIADIHNKLNQLNLSSSNLIRADLSGIKDYAVGDQIKASLFNLIEEKNLEIFNSYCTCHVFNPCSCVSACSNCTQCGDCDNCHCLYNCGLDYGTE